MAKADWVAERSESTRNKPCPACAEEKVTVYSPKGSESCVRCHRKFRGRKGGTTVRRKSANSLLAARESIELGKKLAEQFKTKEALQEFLDAIDKAGGSKAALDAYDVWAMALEQAQAAVKSKR